MSKAPRKITVVTEDAYKQNNVYRPWSDIIANRGASANTADNRDKSRLLNAAYGPS